MRQKLIERVRRTALTAGLLGNLALIGCDTVGGRNYDCNALNYPQIAAQQQESDLSFLVGGLLGGAANTLRNPAAASALGNTLTARGSSIQNNIGNQQSSKVFWTHVADGSINNTYDVACLSVELNNGTLLPSGLKDASSAFNLANLEKAGFRYIIFNTTVCGYGGNELEMYIYRTDNFEKPVVERRGINIPQLPAGSCFPPILRIPIGELRSSGAVGPCKVDWRVKRSSDEPYGMILLPNSYYVTLCPD